MKRRLLHTAIILLLVAGLVVTTADRAGRLYFSPHALEEHSQSELTICMIGVPFYRSPRREFKNPLLQLIVKKGATDLVSTSVQTVNSALRFRRPTVNSDDSQIPHVSRLAESICVTAGASNATDPPHEDCYDNQRSAQPDSRESG